MRHALFKSFRIHHDVGVQDSQNLKGQQLAIVNNYNNSIKYHFIRAQRVMICSRKLLSLIDRM